MTQGRPVGRCAAFIYFIEAHPTYVPALRPLFAAADREMLTSHFGGDAAGGAGSAVPRRKSAAGPRLRSAPDTRERRGPQRDQPSAPAGGGTASCHCRSPHPRCAPALRGARRGVHHVRGQRSKTPCAPRPSNPAVGQLPLGPAAVPPPGAPRWRCAFQASCPRSGRLLLAAARHGLPCLSSAKSRLRPRRVGGRGFRFDGLAPHTDGLFLKLSYLFRSRYEWWRADLNGAGPHLRPRPASSDLFRRKFGGWTPG